GDHNRATRERARPQQAVPRVETLGVGGETVDHDGHAHLLSQLDRAHTDDFARALRSVDGHHDAAALLHDLHGLARRRNAALALVGPARRRATDDVKAEPG